MGFYTTTVTTDASGDGTNLDALGNSQWSGVFRGMLMGMRVEFGASPDAGTDTVLSEPKGLKRTIQTLTDTSTSTNKHPVVAADGVSGASVYYFVESSNLKVTVAGGGDTKTVIVTVLILED